MHPLMKYTEALLRSRDGCFVINGEFDGHLHSAICVMSFNCTAVIGPVVLTVFVQIPRSTPSHKVANVVRPYHLQGNSKIWYEKNQRMSGTARELLRA